MYRVIQDLGKYPHKILLGSFEGIEVYGIVLDIIDVFTSIYYCDIKIKENEPRLFKLDIPVTNVELWNECKKALNELVQFVSKDRLEITFYQKNKPFQKRIFNNLLYSFDCNTLISGGLDSFCGAYNNIVDKNNSVYTGYKINYYEQSKQRKIVDFLNSYIKTRFFLFDKLKVKKNKPTQRTRSLFFLSLACAISVSFAIKKIYLYENGVLSLNPELSGRFTTKSTHPKTIYLFNKILSKLNLDITIINPFIFKTKGSIINNLNEDFKEQIKNTYTCGRSRQNPNVNASKQCGFCIPCILRKISIAGYDLEDYDVEYQIPYNIKLSDINKKYIRNNY